MISDCYFEEADTLLILCINCLCVNKMTLYMFSFSELHVNYSDIVTYKVLMVTRFRWPSSDVLPRVIW
jgi:hypothetical protein